MRTSIIKLCSESVLRCDEGDFFWHLKELNHFYFYCPILSSFGHWSTWVKRQIWKLNILFLKRPFPKSVSLKWVPEQKLVWPVFVPVPIFESHIPFQYQYLKATFCSGTNIWETHSVPVTSFSRPYFVPVTSFSGGGAP